MIWLCQIIYIPAMKNEKKVGGKRAEKEPG
jgi:hypothetical protein